MENRQDYLGSQVDILTKVLRKLLEKLLKTKSADSNDAEIQETVTSEMLGQDLPNIGDLATTDDTKLISILTQEHYVSSENLKLLGDLFYELYKLNHNLLFAKKASILYNYIVVNTGKNLDISVFMRKQELDELLQ